MPQQYPSSSAANLSDMLEQVRWITSLDAEMWLTQAAENLSDVMKLTQSLRAELTPWQTHRVVELAELRRRAQQKFSHARRMYFTRQSLEQATDEVIGRYKAARFGSHSRVVDLCCGIGGDWLALAERGPVLGVDCDPAIVHLARANAAVLNHLQNDKSNVEVADVEKFSVAGFDSWHIDPDRRAQGTRTTRVEFYAPGPEVISRFLRELPSGAVKMAPAAELPAEWKSSAESEWISRDGECKQLVAWFGGLARCPGKHAATVLQSSSRRESEPRSTDVHATVRTLVGEADRELPPANQVAQYVFEVDAAVLAAKLSGVLAEEHQISSLDVHGGYLTGDRLISDGALTPFVVQ